MAHRMGINTVFSAHVLLPEINSCHRRRCRRRVSVAKAFDIENWTTEQMFWGRRRNNTAFSRPNADRWREELFSFRLFFMAGRRKA